VIGCETRTRRGLWTCEHQPFDDRGDLHIAHVALHYGERPEVAYALPFAIDGLLIVATTAMLDDTRHTRHVRWSARMAFTFGVTASLAANIASAQATPAPGSWPPSRPSPYSWPSKSSPAPAAPWSPSPHRPTPVEQRQRPTARGRTQPTTTHTLAQPTNAAANIAGATGQRRTHAEPATDHRDGHRRQSGRTPRGHPGREHRHSGHPTRGVATYRPATPVRPAANGPHLTGHRPRATIVAIEAHRPRLDG